jgi:hypothetical protein
MAPKVEAGCRFVETTASRRVMLSAQNAWIGKCGVSGARFGRSYGCLSSPVSLGWLAA